MFDVVGVGDLDVDIYIELDKIPGHDEKILSNKHHYHIGGMVANSIVALSRLGKKCILHAPVGDDYYGKLAIAGIESNFVNTSGVVMKPKGTTYFCLVMLDNSGEKSLIVNPTDCMALNSEDIKQDVISSAKHMHTILFDNVETAIGISRSNNMSISIDIEPSMLKGQDEKRIKNIIEKVDIVFLGEEAAEIIGNAKSPTKNAQAINSLGSNIVCVTQGSKGGIISAQGNLEEYFAYKGAVIDTTGAGDCFAAGFIYGYLEKWEIQKSAQFASAVAAIKTMSYGGHDGAPDLDEVTRFMSKVQ
jgi:ribokinase